MPRYHVAPPLPVGGNAVTRWIGRAVLRVLGWRIEGRLLPIPKFVAIVAPHTSNWDWVIGLAAILALGIRASYMIKREVVRGPCGWFFRATHAVPIDRSAPRGLVEQTVEAFRRNDELVLGITPEGTRKRVDRWKRGFYYIAKGAGVPIVLVSWDYRNKVFGLGPAIEPSNDEEADLAWMVEYYAQFQAKVPEHAMTRPLATGEPAEARPAPPAPG